MCVCFMWQTEGTELSAGPEGEGRPCSHTPILCPGIGWPALRVPSCGASRLQTPVTVTVNTTSAHSDKVSLTKGKPTKNMAPMRVNEMQASSHRLGLIQDNL